MDRSQAGLGQQRDEGAYWAEVQNILRLGWWMFSYFTRRVVFSKVVPKILLLLSILEVLGPIHAIYQHVFLKADIIRESDPPAIKPPAQNQQQVSSAPAELAQARPPNTQQPQQSKWIKWLDHPSLSILFSLTAAFMVWHHHKLDKRGHRLRGLIGRINSLISKDELRRISGAVESHEHRLLVRNALTDLVKAVMFRNERFTFHACLLVKYQGSSGFKIFEQSRGSSFKPDLNLDEKDSVAGNALLFPSSLIYVPRAKYRHGVRLGTTRVPKAYRQVETHDGDPDSVKEILLPLPLLRIYRHIDAENHELVSSILCVRVPFSAHSHWADAVLCLSSPSPDCVGDLEHSAIRFFASLLSLAFLPERVENKPEVSKREIKSDDHESATRIFS